MGWLVRIRAVGNNSREGQTRGCDAMLVFLEAEKKTACRLEGYPATTGWLKKRTGLWFAVAKLVGVRAHKNT